MCRKEYFYVRIQDKRESYFGWTFGDPIIFECPLWDVVLSFIDEACSRNLDSILNPDKFFRCKNFNCWTWGACIVKQMVAHRNVENENFHLFQVDLTHNKSSFCIMKDSKNVQELQKLSQKSSV